MYHLLHVVFVLQCHLLCDWTQVECCTMALDGVLDGILDGILDGMLDGILDGILD